MELRPTFTKNTQIIQIVRNYGKIGGMETYVWHLSSELAKLGHNVLVLCATQYAVTAPIGVNVVKLGQIHPKPRWLAHLRFSRLVSLWVTQYAAKLEKNNGCIIHSHERTAIHHCTTFHGPPFAVVRQQRGTKRLGAMLSPRVYANLWLERREVCGAQVKAVIPNSSHIATALRLYYPCAKLVQAIVPGVTAMPLRSMRLVPTDGGILGFVGIEWKRKGLPLVAKIFAAIQIVRPAAQLHVLGPQVTEIAHLFTGMKNVFLHGRQEIAQYLSNWDVLLHPASCEPYGMVIIEAMAARVPVVISDCCGAATDVSNAHGSVLKLEQAIDVWVQTSISWLQYTQALPAFKHSWYDVAKAHTQLYSQL